MSALQIATALASQPWFDGLHDPDKSTALIEPYHDPVGYPTQGYGRLLSTVIFEPLDKYPAITVAQAYADLTQDIARSQRFVRALIDVDLNDNQEAALIDFAFNCGPANLKISTLRKVINRGDLDQAPKQLMRWVFAKGRRLNGLVRRRQAEADLWVV